MFEAAQMKSICVISTMKIFRSHLSDSVFQEYYGYLDANTNDKNPIHFPETVDGLMDIIKTAI